MESTVANRDYHPDTNTPDQDEQDESLTTHRVADAARSALDEAEQKAESFERSIRKKARDANKELSDRQEATYEQFEQTLARAEAFVREKPLLAAGAAFAAGIVATSILRR